MVLIKCALALNAYLLVTSPALLAPRQSQEPQQKIQALYNSLDPLSMAQALAFYELYPSSQEGQKALERAACLLNVPACDKLRCLFAPIAHLKGREEQQLSDEQLLLIEEMASHLPNRKLKGYWVETEQDVIALDTEEIDLAKALILSQMEGSEEAVLFARRYSALIDLMALQILARLPAEPTAEEKIRTTNWFIFDQMHFKFPPQSVYAENIDLYTFLPSVMDNHLGVCLGVTALYLSLAQRIALPLEIITPVGHIYVRCCETNKQINIETTARGIHVGNESYISMQSPTLPQRTLKEVIGMTHVNQASTYLYKAEYARAIKAYEKALPYMPNDPLIQELLGYSYLFCDNEKGEELLRTLGADAAHTMAEDYLNGKVGLEGIEAAFMMVDENRTSLLAKQRRLSQILENAPDFRDGLHQLAVTWIQLNRFKEAIEALTRAFELDDTDPITSYYLAILHGQRQDFKRCWFYLKKAEDLTAAENFYPKALKELRQELESRCPD